MKSAWKKGDLWKSFRASRRDLRQRRRTVQEVDQAVESIRRLQAGGAGDGFRPRRSLLGAGSGSPVRVIVSTRSSTGRAGWSPAGPAALGPPFVAPRVENVAGGGWAFLAAPQPNSFPSSILGPFGAPPSAPSRGVVAFQLAGTVPPGETISEFYKSVSIRLDFGICL
jgi:hypothetical protein